jgi:ATP-dependent phosphofructokinase / diphosphate-dependent phosphofructokinase
MHTEKKAVGIVVGGGPAPGINGVISAATIEAINRGHKVYGIINGFSKILEGKEDAITELTIRDVSRIHSEGGSLLRTSRANPTKSPEMLKVVIDALYKSNIGYLVTIGGDDTAYSASVIAESSLGKIAVAHVPKTIDNDLPLPGKVSTFGYQSAREVGTEIVETLMVDARTAGRWYFVIAMGRKAGHLALGIGLASGATLTIIPEEFGDKHIPLSMLVDILVGAMLKRFAKGRNYGVAVLAEGLLEKLDINSIPELQSAEKDPHGNIRYSEVDFDRIISNAVKKRLAEFEVNIDVVAKNVGYELRCRPPVTFDREYTRELGYGVVDFLLNGGSSAMITRQEDAIVPIPFSNMIDPVTKKTKLRLVDTNSLTYKVARKYMIRLTKEDFHDELLMDKMTKATNMTIDDLRVAFSDSLGL